MEEQRVAAGATLTTDPTLGVRVSRVPSAGKRPIVEVPGSRQNSKHVVMKL
jgi:hypothetical protein